MAVVVSHAMRRFPLSSPDTSFSYNLQDESTSLNWLHQDQGASALARSMRYADSWLYGGSVRSSNALVFTPALVLCTCPDYVNGTKRSTSKKSGTHKSTCKKCKGTRLPFPNGTTDKYNSVRCYPNTTSSTAVHHPQRAGTVRHVPTFSRPTILPADASDPYDLMRRNRLTVPTNDGALTTTRARSNSPGCNKSNTGRSIRTVQQKPDLFATMTKTSGISGRRSILECDINPYDLMTRNQTKALDLKNKPTMVPPIIESTPKECVSETSSNNNRFKSILKKPTTTFGDTVLEDVVVNSPSPMVPQLKCGSHFYLPMPNSDHDTNNNNNTSNTVSSNNNCNNNSSNNSNSSTSGGIAAIPIRKKVQFFIDESELVCCGPIDVEDHNDDDNDDDDDQDSGSNETIAETPTNNNNNKNSTTEVATITTTPTTDQEETRKKLCRLRRSISERLKNDTTNQRAAIFYDSMALRRLVRQDIRIVFDEKELARLDGITARKLKIRPCRPAPPPPPKADDGVADSPPPPPPRKRSSTNTSRTNQISIVTMAAPSNNNNQDYPVQSKVTVNRTVVQVNGPETTVHRLQIRNESPECSNPLLDCSESSSPQRKTSIMINGNDCYSTVNVNDDIPLYQSSVVVGDDVSGNNVSVGGSTFYITDNSSGTKPLQTVLNDPVEAIRRNLIPHVCGKTDLDRKATTDGAEALGEALMSLQNLQNDDNTSDHSCSTQYELLDNGSECYTDNSNRSSVTEEELANRTKFYELLAESAVVEVGETDDHHYESLKIHHQDPIYEEIGGGGGVPPPLPRNPPPSNLMDDLQLDKEYTTRSIFEGASKYDILSYLVDAKERGIVPEDSYTYSFGNSGVIVEEDALIKDTPYNRPSHLSTVSDSSEENSLIMSNVVLIDGQKVAEVERNDSGVGSETSKSSLSKYRTTTNQPEPLQSCEDCESVVDGPLATDEALLCRKCVKKRSERKEIITEIVDTEEKYSRDLQIILEEFYQPMLVAGLLTPDQLGAIFLNVEELLENSQSLAERLRDAVEIATEQGDEDLLTVNIGKLFLDTAPMLHAFETYCIRQGGASLLLASLEKDKELLRIFLRVSQMENTMLRRMNLNSFLMVPVQRVTKYPLLLARLYKVTPAHHETKEQLKEAQHKIELHLNHMNSETRDVPSKLWRRIGSSTGRRSSAEMDLVNIKLRKIAVDVLEWNHDEAKFALEGKLLFTQPADNNWRKGRTIKLSPVNALLVINGKSQTSAAQKSDESGLIFSRNTAIREAALLLVRDKNGRHSLLREPLYLDKCVIAADPAWQSYFEVQELLGKDTFIFKAEDDEQTKIWYTQLQYHAQGMGAWRKRRNALANIMINGMGLRT